MWTVDDVARLIQIKSRIVIYLFIFPSVAYDPEMTKIRSITKFYSVLFILLYEYSKHIVQPVVRPVVEPPVQPTAKCKRTFSQLQSLNYRLYT